MFITCIFYRFGDDAFSKSANFYTYLYNAPIQRDLREFMRDVCITDISGRRAILWLIVWICFAYDIQ